MCVVSLDRPQMPKWGQEEEEEEEEVMVGRGRGRHAEDEEDEEEYMPAKTAAQEDRRLQRLEEARKISRDQGGRRGEVLVGRGRGGALVRLAVPRGSEGGGLMPYPWPWAVGRPARAL